MSSRCERSRWKKLSYHQFSHVMTHPGIMRFCMHYVKCKLHRVESHLHFWRQEKLNRLPGGREGGRKRKRARGREGESSRRFPREISPICQTRRITNHLFIVSFLLAEIPKNEYNNKNQSTGNSPIKVELQNNMDR